MLITLKKRHEVKKIFFYQAILRLIFFNLYEILPSKEQLPGNYRD